jgi:hypothetical protein
MIKKILIYFYDKYLALPTESFQRIESKMTKYSLYQKKIKYTRGFFYEVKKLIFIPCSFEK